MLSTSRFNRLQQNPHSCCTIWSLWYPRWTSTWWIQGASSPRRCDAKLRQYAEISRIKFTACLKNMAQMDIAERRQSQDGKYAVGSKGRRWNSDVQQLQAIRWKNGDEIFERQFWHAEPRYTYFQWNGAARFQINRQWSERNYHCFWADRFW